MLAADTFVMLDDVQFPRRGWVHRNKIGDKWLTLPIAKCPQDTRICDLRFIDGAFHELQRRLDAFSLTDETPEVRTLLRYIDPIFPVVDYLIDLLDYFAYKVARPHYFARSSALGIDPSIHGQDRIIAICQHYGATSYVNPSGGRALYDHDTFAKAGIELGFLKPWEGSFESILTRLQTEDPAAIREEILNQTVILP
jgi:hypothetical protein